MQKDIQKTNTVCFLKAVQCSNSIKHLFDLSLYEHGYWNIADFTNFLQVFQVKFLDQYFACEYNSFLTRVESRFDFSYGKFPISFFPIYNKILLNLACMLVKVLMTISMLLVMPEKSEVFTAYQYMLAFFLDGGFQNLGVATQIFISYFADYQAPVVYRPL